MNNTYTREEFNHRRLIAKQAIQRDSIFAAVTSVVVGLASPGFLHLMDKVLSGTKRVVVSLITFGLFIGIVGWLLVRMKQTARKFAVICPQCEVALQADAERIAAATGKCEKCGGLVIAE